MCRTLINKCGDTVDLRVETRKQDTEFIFNFLSHLRI